MLREHGGLKSLVPPLPDNVSRRREFFAGQNRAAAGEICASGDGHGFEQTDNLELETDCTLIRAVTFAGGRVKLQPLEAM